MLEYVRAGGDGSDEERDYWRRAEYQLLVALDQPRTLEAKLRDWSRDELATARNTWRRVLAMVLAEQGKLRAAIPLLEAVRADDELPPQDYRTLGGWYLAVDRREDRERALAKVYEALPDYQLRNQLSQALRPWQRDDGPLPAELNENILRMFEAGFAKSQSPENYLYTLRDFYRVCKDFRLLASLPAVRPSNGIGRDSRGSDCR